ncbi:MAG: cbb3-type cytochrome oxidase assembly protein CcoS [Gammaproteobacteria bacterium]|nr:cbb3-type cytochrome oxidase assembly protein CcoS [Gammaproteobacteria bacterium]
MEIIYILIPLSLVLLGVALWAFFWAVRNGQFDDLESPASEILEPESNSENTAHDCD